MWLPTGALRAGCDKYCQCGSDDGAPSSDLLSAHPLCWILPDRVESFQTSAGDFEDLAVTVLLKSLFNTLSGFYMPVCSAFMSIMMTLQACFESVFNAELLLSSLSLNELLRHDR